MILLHFLVGQGLVGRTIGQTVAQAFLSLRNVFAAEHVENIHRLQMHWLRLADGFFDLSMSGFFRNQHGQIPTNGWKGGKRLEGSLAHTHGKEAVQVQLTEKHFGLDVIFLGDAWMELPQRTKDMFAEDE